MRPSRPLISFGVILLGVCLVLPAKAQDNTTAPVRVHETMALQRLDGPITLDGLIDEAAWQKIAPYPLTMSTPTFGSALTERTEIRIAYDDATSTPLSTSESLIPSQNHDRYLRQILG